MSLSGERFKSQHTLPLIFFPSAQQLQCSRCWLLHQPGSQNEKKQSGPGKRGWKRDFSVEPNRFKSRESKACLEKNCECNYGHMKLIKIKQIRSQLAFERVIWPEKPGVWTENTTAQDLKLSLAFQPSSGRKQAEKAALPTRRACSPVLPSDAAKEITGEGKPPKEQTKWTAELLMRTWQGRASWPLCVGGAPLMV